MRGSTATERRCAFRPGVNKTMTIPRYLAMFPDRHAPLPPIDDGYLCGELPPLRWPSIEWLTWVMGFPRGWLTGRSLMADIHEHIRQQEEVQGRQFTGTPLERLMSTGTQGALDLRREYYRVFEQ